MAEPKTQGYILKLEDIDRGMQDVGSKAAALGELLKAGVEVPPGFVVKASAFADFLRSNRLDSKLRTLFNEIDIEDYYGLVDACSQAQGLILQSEFPEAVFNEMKAEYEELSVGKEVREIGGVALDMIKAGRGHSSVSVRASVVNDKNSPSNTAVSFNISSSELPRAIKECWSSLFTPHAVHYRKTMGLEAVPRTAVLVQKMLEPEKSFVVFTSYPIKTGSQEPPIQATLIEASWGIGSVINSGEVVPDEYVVDRESGNLAEKRISKKLYMKRTHALSGRLEKETVPREDISKQVMDESEIRKLWELGKNVEEHYSGQPQIVEGCVQRKKVFILQTRPIPRIKQDMQQEMFEAGDTKPLLSGIAASSGVARGTARIVLYPRAPQEIKEGDIIITKFPGPEFLPLLNKAKAIVSDFGGRACCNALASRENGLPCITGTETATGMLQEGQDIIVDATEGNVYPYTEPQPSYQPVGQPAGFANAPTQQPMESRPYEQGFQAMPLNSNDSVATEVKVSLSFPEPANTETSDGVGILRAEHMLTGFGKHPMVMARTAPEELVKNLSENIGKVAKAYYPKPVWYRIMSIRTDELNSFEGSSEQGEENPIMGWRGIRRSLDEPDVFRCELEAIRRVYQQGITNIAIALPFVSSISELRRAKDFAGSLFSANGQQTRLPRMGIIIEAPAAALEAEAFCREGIDFVSIDLSTLAQLTLGMDNENSKVSKMFSETEPAVVSLIRHVIGVCRHYKVKTSVFGEATNDPRVIEILVGLGIDSISAESDVFHQTKDIIARSEKKLLLERARNGQKV